MKLSCGDTFLFRGVKLKKAAVWITVTKHSEATDKKTSSGNGWEALLRLFKADLIIFLQFLLHLLHSVTSAK